MPYQTAVDANALLIELTAGVNFSVPVIDLDSSDFKVPLSSDLYAPVTKIKLSDLTTRVVKGDGTFDGLMESMSAHLKAEFEKGRITGADYTKAYIALTEASLQSGLSLLLGKEQSFWQAQTAQIQALTARVQLETAKMQLAAARMEAMTQQANFGLTKAKIANEDLAHVSAQYTITNLLPQQLKLLTEQTEVQRAQTMNTRTDGDTVVGVIGKQKDLYSQQITSYQRDAEMKIGKLFSDAWITQKTIDEGTLAPANFTNANIDAVLTSLRSKGGF